MASTYTLNNGIELIGTGEQSGTWGDTTNTNLSLLDTALDGQVTVTLATAGTSGSPNALPISDGSASDGRNRMIIFADGGDLGATAYVQLTPNDAEKIIYIRNDLSGSRSILFFQGTYNASNDYEVPAGTTAVIYFDGGGTGAVAANVFNNAYFDSLRLGSLSVTAILDEDDMSSDSATSLATQQSIKAYVDTQVGANNELSEVLANGNTSGGNAIQMTTTDELQFRDTALKISSSADGQLDIDADTEIEIVAPTVDIDASTAMTIDTAALTVTGAVDLNTSLNVDGTVTSDGLTVDGNMSVDGGTIKLDGNYPLGTDNVALGNNTLNGSITSASGNIAIGDSVLSAITTGANAVAIGRDAMSSGAYTGGDAIAIGRGALASLTSGSSNVAVGALALNSNLTGSSNTMAGYQAGYLVGDEIVATAIVSGVNYTIQTSGSTDFTLIGAADSNPGTTFTATGAGTGTGTASANAGFNTFIGYQSGDEMIGGSRNTIIGSFNGNQNTVDIRNSNYNIVISDGNGNPRMFYNNSVPELVFNEQSSAVDFRVESNTQAYALFVEGSSNFVGVNTSSSMSAIGSSGGGLIVGPGSTNSDVEIDVIAGGAWFRGDSTNTTNWGYSGLQIHNQGSFRWGLISQGGNEAKILSSNDGSTIVENARFAPSGFTFNEDGGDIDFRVESDTDTHAFFVDAANDRVGIKTADPTGAYALQLGSQSGTSGEKKTLFLSMGGRYSTDSVSSNQYQFAGFIGTTFSGTDVYTHTSGEVAKNFYMGLATDNAYFNNDRFVIVQGGEERFKIEGYNAPSVIINEGGADADFRVESATNSNAIFMNAANGTTAFGTTTDDYNSSTNEGIYLNPGSSSSMSANSPVLRLNRNGTGGNNRSNLELYNNGTLRGFFGSLGVEGGMYFGSGNGAVTNMTLYEDETVVNEDSVDHNFRVETDNYNNAFQIDAGLNTINLGVDTISNAALWGGTNGTGYAQFKINASGSEGSGEAWITSNRLRYSESTNQFQRSSATEKASMILLDENANIKFYTQPSTTQTGTYSLNAKAILHADGHFNALGVGYGVQGAETDTTNLLAGKITSASSVSYDFELDSSTGDWSGGYVYIKASTVNSNQASPAAAWWFYRIMHYNGGLSAAVLSDSGGDTGSFTITISDQGGTDPITVRVNIAHSNNRLTTSVECGNYYGVRSVS